MHIFLTGGTGFIGRRLIPHFISHKHTILALSRTLSSDTLLTSLGAIPLRGDLTDHAALTAGASEADAVVHLAFIHDFSDFGRSCEVDRGAIEALAEGMKGKGEKGGVLMVSGGTMGLAKAGEGEGEAATEETEDDVGEGSQFAARSENALLVKRLGREMGFESVVVRFAGSVHGVGDGAFVTVLAGFGRGLGGVPVVEGAGGRWPAVYVGDAVEVVRLVVERGKRGTYHAVAEEGVDVGEVAAVVAERSGMATKVLGAEEAREKMGFFHLICTKDMLCSSKWTREVLGWTPKGPGLLQDIKENYVFE